MQSVGCNGLSVCNRYFFPRSRIPRGGGGIFFSGDCMKKFIISFGFLVGLFCLCCLPSFALSNRWSESEVTASWWSGFAEWAYSSGEIIVDEHGRTVSGGYEYDIGWINTEYANITLIYQNFMTFPVEVGDYICPHANSIGGWLGGASNKIYGARFVFFDENNNILARGDYFSTYTGSVISGGNTYNIPWKDQWIKVNQAGQVTKWGLQILLECNQTGILSISRPNFFIGYGNRDYYIKPGATNESTLAAIVGGDNHTKPNGSNISGFESAESGLLNGQNAALGNVADILKGFSLSNAAKGLSFWLSAINITTGSLSWLNNLITVSLSLGLLLFILGVLPSLLDRVDRVRSSKPSRQRKKRGWSD